RIRSSTCVDRGGSAFVSDLQPAEQAAAYSLGWSAAEPKGYGTIKTIKPAKRATARCYRLISLAIITIGADSGSVACSAGLGDLGTSSWGCAALHLRLYTAARVRGLFSNENLGYDKSDQSAGIHR